MKCVTRKLSPGLLVSLACAATATAHDLWIQPDAFSATRGATVLLALNIGHGESRQLSPIARDRITRFAAIAPTGARVDLIAGGWGSGQMHVGSMRVPEVGT